ncbi:MAG: aspartate aminotransferase [Candidatus Muproteobacteria bacterium RBG_19FT_COMBO_61_10]|uniref:Aminotransferase n=1 Tax=Candidatus Muproteobacteria bacterium RBG_19FT_COMBO_61_10 TaxID=1817761 RepID=A0A1F6UJT6_9PROT|nr:MAG: aspartate aminotransferase [Candidatus Muproteobacteria bacterium RBG_19FT_COMBO_61_10]
MRLSARVQRIKPSPTLAVDARAKELKAQGKDIISLGTGEPDFDTPQHIKDAAIRAIQDGFTKYTAVDGIPSLKQAIIAKFKRDNGLDYNPDQILVSVGGKQSFFNLAQALLDAGDEVIIPAPYWVSYPDMVLLADATPVIIAAGIQQQFKITPQQLDAAIGYKTRLVVINSPSNPTGSVYNRAELLALGEVLRKYPDVLIATDDMYEHILWSGEPFSNILGVCPDLTDRTIVLNGVSKAYAMTGWRIGYAAGPKALIGAMKNIQSQSTSNPTSIAQVAAEAALNGDQGCITPMLRAFRERHDHVVARLNAIRGVRCLPSWGTFYSFPSVQAIISDFDGIDNDVELAEYILNEAGVAVVPGSAFGAEGYLRLSFATSLDNLNAALDRLERLFGRAET